MFCKAFRDCVSIREVDVNDGSPAQTWEEVRGVLSVFLYRSLVVLWCSEVALVKRREIARPFRWNWQGMSMQEEKRKSLKAPPTVIDI